jgi:hypothetical protein
MNIPPLFASLVARQTSALLAKLKCEGVSVGTYKIDSKQFKDVFTAVNEEYLERKQDEFGTLDDITKSYAMYNSVKNGSIEDLKRLIEKDPTFATRHMIFVAVENNKADQFMMLIEFLKAAPRNIVPSKLLTLITIEAFEHAIGFEASEILQLFISNQIQIDYDVAMAYHFISQLNTNIPVIDKVMGYVIDTFKGDIQGLWELFLRKPNLSTIPFIPNPSEIFFRKLQMAFKINLSEKDLDIFIENNQGVGKTIQEILDKQFTTKDRLIAINDLAKIVLLTSKNAITLYQNGITRFNNLANIYNLDRIKILTSYSILSLCEKGLTSFDTLIRLDMKKLEILEGRSYDITELIRDHGIKFDDLANMDINKLKEGLGNTPFNHYGVIVSERVEALKTTIVSQNETQTGPDLTYHFQHQQESQTRERAQQYLQQLSGSDGQKKQPKIPPTGNTSKI